jgi:hypothetical protein
MSNVKNEQFQLNENELRVDEKRLIAKKIQTERAVVGMFYRFLRAFNINPAIYCLDKVILKDIASRYFRDVKRIHDNHEFIPRIDRHKIAGYMTYWICKLRPISVVYSQVYQNNPITPRYINELFALYVAMGRIVSHYESFGINKTMIMSNDFLETFMYSLRFRPTTGDTLSMEYYLLENYQIPTARF